MNRRGFISTLATIAAGSAIVPYYADAEMMARNLPSSRTIFVLRNGSWQPVLNLSKVKVGELFFGADGPGPDSYVLPIGDDPNSEDYIIGLCEEEAQYLPEKRCFQNFATTFTTAEEAFAHIGLEGYV